MSDGTPIEGCVKIVHDVYQDAPEGRCSVTKARHAQLGNTCLLYASDDKRSIEVRVCQYCGCLYYWSEPKPNPPVT